MAKHASPSAHLQVVESPKSVAVQIPLPVLGALVDGKSALFDLCVSVGQQVLGVLMEHDRDTCCGPKGKQDPERKAVRAGSTRSEVTLGGRRIQVRRLRARGAAGELALPSFVFAADRDPLDRHTLEAIACGVSTRKYARSLEPLFEAEERSISKSAVSRRFVALSQKQMTAWLTKLQGRGRVLIQADSRGAILADQKPDPPLCAIALVPKLSVIHQCRLHRAKSRPPPALRNQDHFCSSA